MKKALTYTLAATLLMASLTACGNQADDKQANSSDVTIEYGEVNSTKENEPTEVMSTAEMYKIFEEVYANRKSSKIDESELSAIKSKADQLNKLLPGDYEFQYIGWRPVTDHSQVDQYFDMKSETKTLKVDVTIYDDFSDDAPQLGQFTKNTEVTILGTGIPGTDAEGWLSISSGLTDSPFFIKNGDLFEESAEDAEDEEDELFKSVNETVYATENVNIRESYSATSTKLGQLTKGQSVTRIGIGQGEVSDWSQVRLSDGTIAYINSKYLSTTKPAQSTPSQSKPSNNTGTNKPAKQEPAVQEPAGTGTFHGYVPDRVKDGDGGLVEMDPNTKQLDPNDESGWIG